MGREQGFQPAPAGESDRELVEDKSSYRNSCRKEMEVGSREITQVAEGLLSK